jgi:hypothetical protein
MNHYSKLKNIYILIKIHMPCELCRVIFACKYIFIQACYLVIRISI